MSNTLNQSVNVVRSISIPLHLIQETEEAAFMLDSSVSGLITVALVEYLQKVSLDIPTEFPDTPLDFILDD